MFVSAFAVVSPVTEGARGAVTLWARFWHLGDVVKNPFSVWESRLSMPGRTVFDVVRVQLRPVART